MAHDTDQKHGLYFESILQLRDVDKEVIDFTEDEIFRVKLKIAKTVALKNGIDYYLSDNSLTRALGKRLKDKFGGDIKVTSSLWGVKKDREVYRVTVLFRGVPFKKNEIVTYDGEDYKVVSLSKDIFLQAVKHGKKVHIRYHRMNQIRKKVD
ncbi:hypothetical protein HOE37_05570 [Candidatus Woesearchaeota archaeon]|jgi:NMD protein affecting ribosome stability and mRNA decay|nr:hypothetical protein [Candidatus Woesearchaeota archaeon]MBT4111301.1 hypothetical protein [Candidatus Woesearchaeota archaeon]MBT4335788.1 hypothetical protein [Candidatus Woesearchaeota archaeon]MBT4469234.1 hypothetical protein [Candidatus Woesearchaeota archaeon]MBT6744399.1 hypothetical protein [Candidatus Woesearchaeota archaeon]